jgi:hypothetical protein
MHAIITNKPLPAVKVNTVPGAQTVCASQVFSSNVDGRAARISFSGILGEQLASASGVRALKSSKLPANSPHPTQQGLPCSSALGMNPPSSFPASAPSSDHAEKDAGFNYDRSARRMNRAAILPIISLTIRVLHPIHTDKHED